MDLEKMKSDLGTYKTQLLQIELLISTGQTGQELVDAQMEFKELIKLVEESILSYEKSCMLTVINKQLKETENATNAVNSRTSADSFPSLDNEIASFYVELASTSTDDDPKPASTTKHDAEAVLNNSLVGPAKAGVGSNERIVDEMASFYGDLYLEDDQATCDAGETTSKLAHNNTSYAQFSSTASCQTKDNEFIQHVVDLLKAGADISGRKCQAPYFTDWTGQQYHNAMISMLDEVEGEDVEGTAVDVLFLNPVIEKMKPCPYFLDEKCRFAADECRFSHGYSVSLGELRSFKEPDYAEFKVDSLCLCEKPNGVWARATILDIEPGHQQCTVSFCEQDLKLSVGIDRIVPFENWSADDSDVTSSSDDDDLVTCVKESSKERENASDLRSSRIGAWEDHTRGIGSRIMLKLGYEPGKGLGKSGQGRVLPVPIVVLPPGKSLDYCGSALKSGKPTPQNVKSSDAGATRRPRSRGGVFHFLNKTIGDDLRSARQRKAPAPHAKDHFGVRRDAASDRSVNRAISKTESLMRMRRSEVEKVKTQIARNITTNPLVAKKLKKKLSELVAELKSLESRTDAMELHKSRALTHRKMTKF